MDEAYRRTYELNRPLVTVVIPVYKAEKYLEKCVESVRGQTMTDIEIILVDDGSPDNCPAMCDEYAVKDERIKVIHKENGGLSDARNAGIEAATAQYITFVDSDDCVEAELCEVLYGLIVKENADVSCGRNYYVYDGCNIINKGADEKTYVLPVRKPSMIS